MWRVLETFVYDDERSRVHFHVAQCTKPCAPWQDKHSIAPENFTLLKHSCSPASQSCEAGGSWMTPLQIVQEPLETVQRSTGDTPSPHLQRLRHSSSVSPGPRIRRISCTILLRRTADVSACIVCPQRFFSYPCSVSRALHRLSSVVRVVMRSFPVRVICKKVFQSRRAAPTGATPACPGLFHFKHQTSKTSLPWLQGHTGSRQFPAGSVCNGTLAIALINIPILDRYPDISYKYRHSGHITLQLTSPTGMGCTNH
jgi:hypothetical protein